MRRILYMNTCDRAQVWTTSHCNDQASPRLVVRQMRFVDGNATGETTDGGGGGAIFVRGGRLKIVDSAVRSATGATGRVRTWAAGPCASSTSTPTAPSSYAAPASPAAGAATARR